MKPPRTTMLGDAVRLVILSMLTVSAGYLVRLPMEIALGHGLLGAVTTKDFHGAEGGYRWTRGESSVVFPEPGPGLPVSIVAEVSGFRPRGEPPPRLVLEAAGESLQIRAGRGETVTLKTRTVGWWSSDLEVRFRSETFVPGELDRRALGIRVQSIRLVPEGPPIGLGFAPVRMLVAVSCAVVLLFLWISRHGPPRLARWTGIALAIVWGIGFAVLRPFAALVSIPAVMVIGIGYASDLLFPSMIRVVSEILREAAHALCRGLRPLRSWRSLVLAGSAALAVAAATWAVPVIDVNLGTGHETNLAQNFGGFDQQEGVYFRRALRGAAVDLRDFGGGSTWSIEVTASLPGREQALVLVGAAGQSLEVGLGPGWSTHRLRAKAPFGWRSGLVVDFPSASEAVELRIRKLHVDRGRSLPSVRVAVWVAATALLSVVLLGASGLRGIVPWLGGAVLVVVQAVFLLLEPELITPHLGTLRNTMAAGTIVASIATGVWAVGSRRSILPGPIAAGVAAASVGFVAWLASMLSPLYAGGHFVFHSSIAEQIWQGEFLTYYLPVPGSMLSRQAQWGNIVVPHPCLYHALMAPVAALPREWFYVVEKTGLAAMLAGVALLTSMMAARVAGPRAGAYAGIFGVSLAPSFQLLALGHLMTLFGVFSAALALGFVILSYERLRERGVWIWATVLLTACFLSYTASLLLVSLTLVLALPFLWRSNRTARALTGSALAAATAAFFLYYIHWTVPFLRDSVPAILSGIGSGDTGTSLWARTATIPGKLAYTYENPLVPVVGLMGLGLARRSAERVLLLSWASMLVLFSGADLFFNFLLKHHYLVLPALGVGCAVLTAWLAARRIWGGALALVFLVYVVVLGYRAFLLAALGSS